MSNPDLETATLLFNINGGQPLAYEFGGVKEEIDGYRKSAWIGIPLAWSPIYDVTGPDAVKFLNSICTNNFSKLTERGLRHAVICNEKGQILTDGEADLHDIKFASHRKDMMGDKAVEVIRLGMSGNLAYEIHGPVTEFDEVYRKVWASGQKFGATKLGMRAYSLFNHTEAGFPNIHLHYPMPWLESDEDMAKHMFENPQMSWQQLNRKLAGSVGNDLETRFMTPFDVGWDFLVKFDHDFTGREALEAAQKNIRRKPVTLEWNAEDVAAVFATMLKPGEEACENITGDTECEYVASAFKGEFCFRADKVLFG